MHVCMYMCVCVHVYAYIKLLLYLHVVVHKTWHTLRMYLNVVVLACTCKEILLRCLLQQGKRYSIPLSFKATN